MSTSVLMCCIFLASGFASVESQISNHSNQCYYCGPYDDARQVEVFNPLACRHTKICEDNEVCIATTENAAGTITHEFGCHQLLQCQVITIVSLENQGINTGVDLHHLFQTGNLVGRKRQTDMCDICCGDGLCNNNDCMSIRRRLFQFASTGRLNYTTLRIMA